MDREKLLKKFIAKMVIGHIVVSSVIFIWLFSYECKFINYEQFCKYGLTLFCSSVLLAIVYHIVFGKREKKEILAIMPLIISIHDTEEKLKKQRKLQTWEIFLLVIGFPLWFSLLVAFLAIISK